MIYKSGKNSSLFGFAIRIMKLQTKKDGLQIRPSLFKHQELA